jgi:hypothetical protein
VSTGAVGTGIERRRAARVPMAPGGPVALVGARLLNVSPLGMLIEAPVAMELEAIHRFRLVVGKDHADVEARVAACFPGPRHRHQVGLEFVGLTDELRTRLAEVLKTAGPPSRS